MKKCPQCNRVETDTALIYCRTDGALLITESATTDGEAQTRTLQGKNETVGPAGPTTRLVEDRKESLKRKSRSTKLGLTLGVVILVVIAATAYLYKTRTKTVAAANSIAVLPFMNASGDPTMEYLSDGISESLINSLSQLPNMRVVARTTTFTFKGADSNPSAIGKQLGVSAVLTGKIVQRDDNLSVQVDLVNVSDGSQLWGERYNRKATDLLAVQEEIAREVVETLRVRLSNEDRNRLTKRYTENLDAYRAYLKGRFEWNKRTAEGLNQAIEFFNLAITLDPTYALAYAGLADVYSLLPQYANAPFDDSLMKAKAASLKALELDTSLAEAYISLAFVKHSLWEWSDVEAEFKRGLALNPNYATGHQWYSEYLVPVARLDEARKEIKRAQELDPLSLVITVRLGMTAYFARDLAQAEKYLRDALQFNPEFALTHVFLFFTMYQQGKIEQSIPHFVVAAFKNHSKEEQAKFETEIRQAYSASGKKGMLEKARDLLKASPKPDYGHAHLLGSVLIQLGEKDEAFVWLNRAADVKHPGIPTLRIDPFFDDVRSDPRIEQLMKRVGI